MKKRINRFIPAAASVLAVLILSAACRPAKETITTAPAVTPDDSVTEEQTTKPDAQTEEPDPPEENDDMDLIMLYDIDYGLTINTRPDHGWNNLNPEYPDDPGPDCGQCRVTTSLLGTYDSTDTAVIRQHFYWMAAMGIDAVQCDITNTRSPREPGHEGMAKYFNGTIAAFTSVLGVSAERPENYKNPAAYVSVRLYGDNYDGLKMLLDDLYAIYAEHGDGWYRFNDGTDRAGKPFLVIFADWDLLEKWCKKNVFPFDDERFNIRWSNGYLSGCTKKDADGGRYIEENDPLWLFVENERPGKKGYYTPYYKKGADGSVEMMQTWASLHLGGADWDGMTDRIDGKLCIERYSEPVKKYKPKALLINRWNYPVAWPAEPQEGLSRNKSTHIEPNEDWGFDAFYAVADVTYSLTGRSTAPPPSPKISKVENGRVFFDTTGMPLEVCFSRTNDFSGAEWLFTDISNGTDPGVDTECTLYVKVRGVGGESAATAFSYTPGKDPSEIGEDGVITLPKQLANIKKDGDYTLGADIDMDGFVFTGITEFNGTIDGKGHAIKNLTMAGGSGIFTYIENAVITDLIIDNANIESSGLLTGIVAGKAVRSEISSVTVKNSAIYGARFLGGVAGVNDHSTFEDIILDNVSIIASAADSDTIGGAAGYNEFGMNRRIVFRGNIEAPYATSVGGIIGACLGNASEDGNGVEACFSFGTVNGLANCGTVGGIVGIAHAVDGSWTAPVTGCGAFLDGISDGGARVCGSYGDGCISGNYAAETFLPNAKNKGENKGDGADIPAGKVGDMIKAAGIEL